MSGVFVPGPVGQEIRLEQEVGETTCPAATDGRFADSRRRYIHCGVGRDVLAVAENPVAARAFCCGEYTNCPIWQREVLNADGVEDWRAEIEQRWQDRLTREQVVRGVRVDDRGVEAETASG